MTAFLVWLDKRWPTERGWVTIATFILAGAMLKMAEVHRDLWQVELFKTLLTLVIGTAIVNMILAFHFTANKLDEKRTENTGKLADAFRATAEAGGNTSGPTLPGVIEAATDKVVAGAQDAQQEVLTGNVTAGDEG